MVDFAKLLYYTIYSLLNSFRENERLFAFVLFKYGYVYYKGKGISVLLESKSDISTFIEIFVLKDYAIPQHAHLIQMNDKIEKISNMGLVPVFIDCGANIGLSSLYWSLLHPALRVVAVEMEPSNFNNLKRNTAQLKGVEYYLNALSSEIIKYEVSNENVDNNAYQVSLGEGSNTTITVNTILSLLQMSDKPLIIKIDIEGHENILFESAEWADRFFLVIVEIHDWMQFTKPTSRTLLRLLSEGNYSILTKENLIFAFNLDYRL